MVDFFRLSSSPIEEPKKDLIDNTGGLMVDGKEVKYEKLRGEWRRAIVPPIGVITGEGQMPRWEHNMSPSGHMTISFTDTDGNTQTHEVDIDPPTDFG